jgi:hypothetical protein
VEAEYGRAQATEPLSFGQRDRALDLGAPVDPRDRAVLGLERREDGIEGGLGRGVRLAGLTLLL